MTSLLLALNKFNNYTLKTLFPRKQICSSTIFLASKLLWKASFNNYKENQNQSLLRRMITLWWAGEWSLERNWFNLCWCWRLLGLRQVHWQSFVVIIHSYWQYFLGVTLTYYILVQVFKDLQEDMTTLCELFCD